MSKTKKIKVSFGHNSENVTGSYTLIECGQSGKKILVDFGLIQENVSLLKEYKMNCTKPDFKPKEIDYVFLTHNHQDHQGRIPMLYKMGCTAPIIVPEGSTGIFKAMALDSANIMFRDAVDLTKQNKKEYLPIYNEEDIINTLNHIKEYPVGDKIQIDDNIAFKLTYSGHIFKAVSITLWIKNGSQTRKIVVTGDLGNQTVRQKFTEDFTPYENCNLLIGECTYSNPKRNATIKDREKDLEKIRAVVDTICIDKKGKILIPTFSFGRSPSMLATLYDLFHENKDFDIPIIYASPLGVKLLNEYMAELDEENQKYLNKVLSWKNIKILNSFDQLDAELISSEPKIFCVPSGMMNAGYSVYVASKLLPHAKNAIVFCGYSAEGTLSWKIKQKKTKTISIDGKQVNARCQVVNLNSFSSHAQHDDLLQIYAGGNSKFDKIALVHSEQKAKILFCEELQEELSKRNKTSKVVCVTKGTTINL